MLSGLSEPTAGPLETLLGLLAPKADAASGGESFSALLGLLPLAVPSGMMIPTEDSFGAAAAGENVQLPQGKILLSLAPDLIENLGISVPSSAEPSVPSSPAESQASLIPISGEIVPFADGAGSTFCLRIFPETARTGMAEDSQPEGIASEPILIPMHLRTVEQIGRHVYAEADLQTAAGKEASVRIQWEVSGNLNGNQGLAPNTGVTAGDGQRMETVASPVPLTRLMNDLGVTKVVIESIEIPGQAIMPALLPQTAAITGKATMTKTDRPSVPMSSTPIPAMLVPVQAVSEPIAAINLPISPESVVGPETPPVQMVAENSTEAKATPEAPSTIPDRANGMNVSPILDAAASLPTMENRIEQPQVRFFDLDNKLGQLKANPGQKIRIQLSPASMGKMDLTVASYRGTVTVTLTLDSAQAKEAVQKSLPLLESRLAASGIRVDNFQITVLPQSRQHAWFGQHYLPQQGGYAGYQQQQGDRQPSQRQTRPQNLIPDLDFRSVMVNCLA